MSRSASKQTPLKNDASEKLIQGLIDDMERFNKKSSQDSRVIGKANPFSPKS